MKDIKDYIMIDLDKMNIKFKQIMKDLDNENSSLMGENTEDVSTTSSSESDALQDVSSSAYTCGCKDKQIYHVKVHWGMGEQREFNYCKDCIKEDNKKGMLVEIL